VVPSPLSLGTERYRVKEKIVPANSLTKPPPDGAEENPVRKRIVSAAFSVFSERGFAGTNTLEIATRARVSKRELYALVGNKQEMLVACISERAQRLRMPEDLPRARDRETLTRVLVSFGARLLREVSDPTVVAVFRLAIAEAERTPKVAQALDTIGRETSRAALMEVLVQARSSRLLNGDPAEMAEHFAGLLWGNLIISLLLGVADPPNPNEIKRRVRNATTAFLQLYPPISISP
jgi:AcrR family transcriptional regulator